MAPDRIVIRRAAVEDAAIVAHHRTAMFRDMGAVPSSLDERLRDTSCDALEKLLARGEYVGFLASPADDPARIVAGVGAHCRLRLPFPYRVDGKTVRIAEGREAIVVNVYTEREYRRRSIARALMEALLAWARDTKLDRLVLHAAPDGRALYESLGFVQTNEMAFAGDLAIWSPAKRPAR
jgi:GNAT superfamily N-acetyltransferase